MPGTLYVVATPIGNLEDASPRVLRVLRESAVVACEDTRRTAQLLERFGVATPTVSCHRFNEKERLQELLHRLPDIHVAGEPDMLFSGFIHGIKRMPAEWTPR